MNNQRVYTQFTHKEAVFRICCDRFKAVTQEILRRRQILQAYIQKHPSFKKALEPLEPLPDAPDVVRRMTAAAAKVRVGPMAAVAGVMAQLAAEAGLAAGAEEAIVENGGDIYLKLTAPAWIGIYSGRSDKLNRLAFELQPEETPISICSSSGKMGHSMSMGQCDLATVVAKDAALADAAATQAANLVSNIQDVEVALNKIAGIDGIEGILIVKDGHVGLAGTLPALVRTDTSANG